MSLTETIDATSAGGRLIKRGKERAMHHVFSGRIETALKPLAPARRNALIRAPASCNRTSAPLRVSQLRWSPIPFPRVFASAFPATTHLMTGRHSRKAPISCAQTSPTGAINNPGKPTSSSPRRKPPSASRKTNSTCGRFGTRARIAFRRTSSSVSSPSCCGGARKCGRPARASETRRVPFSKGSRAFPRTM
jgi:hypothetical protein